MRGSGNPRLTDRSVSARSGAWSLPTAARVRPHRGARRIEAAADLALLLAIAVIGGMVSSTLLTLVVVAAVYSVVEQGLQRLRRRSA
jgi:hypothetical protein